MLPARRRRLTKPGRAPSQCLAKSGTWLCHAQNARRIVLAPRFEMAMFCTFLLQLAWALFFLDGSMVGAAAPPPLSEAPADKPETSPLGFTWLAPDTLDKPLDLIGTAGQHGRFLQSCVSAPHRAHTCAPPMPEVTCCTTSTPRWMNFL